MQNNTNSRDTQAIPLGETSVRIGSAPDSWGVWFANDPQQTPWSRFLDEVAEAGNEWIELGPIGYLPVDVDALRTELDARKLKLAGGFVMRHLEDTSELPAIEHDVNTAGRVLSEFGARFLVLIDDFYTDIFTGQIRRSPRLDSSAWNVLINTVAKVAHRAKTEYGLTLAFHPHVETHVEYEDQIEALLNDTDPQLVSLCLDTGHHAYRGGDPVTFFHRHHDRISYLHLKSVDREIMRRVEKEKLPFSHAVAAGVFCEPSKGAVDFVAFRDALREHGYHGWAITEQDMYPAPLNKPLPIAKRTREFLRQIGIG